MEEQLNTNTIARTSDSVLFKVIVNIPFAKKFRKRPPVGSRSKPTDKNTAEFSAKARTNFSCTKFRPNEKITA